MLTTVTTLITKFMPPVPIASRLSLVWVLLITFWAISHQSSANVHIAVQITQFDQIMDNQKQLMKRLDILDDRINTVLLKVSEVKVKGDK